MLALAVYGIVAVVNLVAAYLFKETVRKVTKACLIPALLVFYVLAAQPIHWLIIAALAFSWGGDVFLIRKDEPLFFRLGLGSFLVSHVFYLVAFLNLAGGIHVWGLAISIVIAVPLIVVLLRFLDASPQMKIPVAAYAIVIVAMSVSALQLLLVRPCLGSALVFVGSLIYLFSDTLMAYLLFHTKPKHFNLITMVPYIIAQGTIVVGLVLGV